MQNINLIPQEYKPRAPVLKFAKSLQKIAFTALAVFFVVAVAVVGIMFLLSDRVSNTLSAQEELKKEIKALEQTEQRLVLIKDRLEKSETVLALDNASEEVEILREVIGILNDETEIIETDLDRDRAVIVLSTNKSSNITDMLSSVKGHGNYGSIVFESLRFSDESGYEYVLSLQR